MKVFRCVSYVLVAHFSGYLLMYKPTDNALTARNLSPIDRNLVTIVAVVPQLPATKSPTVYVTNKHCFLSAAAEQVLRFVNTYQEHLSPWPASSLLFAQIEKWSYTLRHSVLLFTQWALWSVTIYLPQFL